MSRVSRKGRGLKRVLAWTLDRDIIDAEIASALRKPPATYSRRKNAPDFPTFEELNLIGEHFGINPRWLQVEFGFLDTAELDDVGRLKVEPTPYITEKRKAQRERLSDLSVRDDAPPLH